MSGIAPNVAAEVKRQQKKFGWAPQVAMRSDIAGSSRAHCCVAHVKASLGRRETMKAKFTLSEGNCWAPTLRGLCIG